MESLRSRWISRSTTLTRPIVEEAIRRTKEAREYILTEVMEKVSTDPVPLFGKYAPKIIRSRSIPRRSAMWSDRGKTINTIIERTGVKIDITDEGAVSICGVDQKSMDEAKRWWKSLQQTLKKARFYRQSCQHQEFGAFIEFAPGKRGNGPHFQDL